jgi:hypothetical protein
MQRYYSQTTQTTYLSGVHATMPDDAVKITEARFLEVIVNPPAGKARGHDGDGLPILIDRPEPDFQLLVERARQWRDGVIGLVQWLISRHRDEIELGLPTTLTPGQFSELLLYVQSLRDWPAAPSFPEPQSRPIEPSWVTDQLQ